MTDLLTLLITLAGLVPEERQSTAVILEINR